MGVELTTISTTIQSLHQPLELSIWANPAHTGCPPWVIIHSYENELAHFSSEPENDNSAQLT